MSAPLAVAPSVTIPGFQIQQQQQIGKTSANHAVTVMNPSSNTTCAKTDKAAAEAREECVKNGGCSCKLEGTPAIVCCSIFCFWNPIAWCCLFPAWKECCCS